MKAVAVSGLLIFAGFLISQTVPGEFLQTYDKIEFEDNYPYQSQWINNGTHDNTRTDAQGRLIIDQLDKTVEERIVLLNTPEEFEQAEYSPETQNANYSEPGLILTSPDPTLSDAEDGVYATNITQERGTTVADLENDTFDIQVDSLNTPGGLYLEIEDPSGVYDYELEEGFNRFEGSTYYQETTASDAQSVERIRGRLNGSDGSAEVDYIDVYIASDSNVGRGSFKSDNIYKGENMGFDNIVVETSNFKTGSSNERQANVTVTVTRNGTSIYSEKYVLEDGINNLNFSEFNEYEFDGYWYRVDMFTEADTSPRIKSALFTGGTREPVVPTSILDDLSLVLFIIFIGIAVMYAGKSMG